MCYAYGSIDQLTTICPMCKVFPYARCPHVHEICRNRSLHPRFDVVYLRNAEVESFNGCGFCKWARTNPPPRAAGMFNHGWPGCCRPPTQKEVHMIPVTDWLAVSIVHQVQVPPEIRPVVDVLAVSQRTMIMATTGMAMGKSIPGGGAKPPAVVTKAAAVPSVIRSNSSHKSPTTAVTTPTKNRSSSVSGSPNNSSSSSSPNSRGSPPSEHKSHPDTPRRSATVRQQASSSPPSHASITKVAPTSRKSTDKSSSPGRASPIRSSPRSEKAPLAATTTTTTAPRPKRDDEPKPVRSSAASSSGSSGSGSGRSEGSGKSEGSGRSEGSGSMTDSSSGSSSGTVMSDGFTDYLSSESDEELQKQAEDRARVEAELRVEELEFKNVRQQLALVTLEPPKLWNPTKAYHHHGDTASAVVHSPAGTLRRQPAVTHT